MASNPAVAFELERLGLAVVDEFDFLEPSDIADNLVRSAELAEQWWPDSWGDTDFLGLSLASLATQEWVLPFELVLNARLAYSRLFASGTYGSVAAFFADPIPMIRTGPAPAFLPARSISHAVLRWSAERAGLPVRTLSTRRPASAEGRQWRPRLTADDLRPKHIPGASPATSRDRDNLVMVWREGLWAQEIDALEALAETHGWHLVTLSTRELETIHDPGLESIEAGIAKKLASAWTRYEAGRIHYCGPHPEIYGNPHLAFQFERVFSEMRSAAHFGLRFSALTKALEPKLLILGYDAFAIERTLVGIAQTARAGTVGILHGGLQPHLGRFRRAAGDASNILVWGPEDARQLPALGVTADRILQTGSVRFDPAYRLAGEHTTPTPSHGRRPLIAFLTAPPTIDLAQASAAPRLHRKTWTDVRDLTQRHPDWRFVINPHPAFDHIDFYKALARSSAGNLSLSAGSLGSVLPECDAAVLVNYCTTAALEAALAKVPVVILREAMYRTHMHRDALQEHGAINVESVPELEAVIERLLTDTAYREAALQDAQLMVAEVLGERQSSPFDRLGSVLSQLAQASAAAQGSSTANGHADGTAADIIDCLSHTGDGRSTDRALGDVLARSARTLPGLPLAVAAAAQTPAELRRWLRSLTRAATTQHLLDRGAAAELGLRGFQLGISRAVNQRRWRDARVLARFALTDMADRALRSLPFLTLVAKSIIGGSRLGHWLINVLDRLPRFWTQLRARIPL